MPKFVVSKGHDAFVYYETVVEAGTREEARTLAKSAHYHGQWFATGYVQEFEDYEIDEQGGVRPLGDGETIETIHSIGVTAHERDAVLGGLRLLQLAIAGSPFDSALKSILTNDGAHAGLDLPEIDALCGRINV